MKIQEVTIEGYQSHTNSTFRLSPGLTVITGPSDAGKTAIIRALRWFAFNEPTGEAFLHTIRNPDGSVKEAVDQVKVSVTFDNGITITKTRRKGKTTYVVVHEITHAVLFEANAGNYDSKETFVEALAWQLLYFLQDNDLSILKPEGE